MSGISKKLMGTTAAGGGQIDISDYFSTYLYTGNGSTQTITNGIDLAGEGGLVWTKLRTDAFSHVLIDTERGGTGACVLSSNSTNAAFSGNQTNLITPFNSDGYTIATDWAELNSGTAGRNYASWTFRKAPRFFDVVTYTGTGSARTIDHNLGTTVGSIIIKRTDTTSNWAVYHRGNTAAPETDFLSLNLTNATADDATYWNDTAPTDSVFTVGTNAAVNASGGTYVAYLFAHDPLGPSEDGSDGLIACGSYTGDGSTDGPKIDLGWEPQWVLVKASSSSQPWYILDNMRGFTAVGGSDRFLNPNASDAEAAFPDLMAPTPTGFKQTSNIAQFNGSGIGYIYIAIRRGPMRAPESGTEVFALDLAGSTGDGLQPRYRSGFPVDLGIYADRDGSSNNARFDDRLRGAKELVSSSSTAEFAGPGGFDFMNGWFPASSSNPRFISWMFRRAPEFFDVVAYTGNDVVGREISHNLLVPPELIIVKTRTGSASQDWAVYTAPTGNTKYMRLNGTLAATVGSAWWNNTTPTSEVFTVGNEDVVNNTGWTYIAYLFATLAGVSKVGSYTGNGSSQTINCGFTTGARFILIKRTDSTGDWYVWDTARGIVAANDPHLSLNTTAAEVTTDDSIDPDSSGFIVNQVAATNINVSAASYIFYAVA